MPTMLGGNQLSTGYEVSNSIRYNDDDAPELNRTPSSAGNRRTWTWSGWIKRGNITAFNVWGSRLSIYIFLSVMCFICLKVAASSSYCALLRS